jgi:hypothetical protein
MNERGLDDVCSFEVIISRTSAWRLGWIDLGWQRSQASNSSDVVETVRPC